MCAAPLQTLTQTMLDNVSTAPKASTIDPTNFDILSTVSRRSFGLGDATTTNTSGATTTSHGTLLRVTLANILTKLQVLQKTEWENKTVADLREWINATDTTGDRFEFLEIVLLSAVPSTFVQTGDYDSTGKLPAVISPETVLAVLEDGTSAKLIPRLTAAEDEAAAGQNDDEPSLVVIRKENVALHALSIDAIRRAYGTARSQKTDLGMLIQLKKADFFEDWSTSESGALCNVYFVLPELPVLDLLDVAVGVRLVRRKE